MTIEILSSGSDVTNSSEISLAPGESATLSLRISDAGVGEGEIKADVQKRGSNGEWYPIGSLTRSEPCLVLQASGAFRVKRVTAEADFGVDRG